MRQLRLMWSGWRPDDRWVFRITAAIVLLTSVIEMIRAIQAAAAPGVAIAVVAVVLAVMLCPWTPWAALGLASTAPVLAGATGWQPIVSWTCAVLLLFAVCSRRGHPVTAALITAPGVILGIALAPGTGGIIPTALGGGISIAAAAAIGSGLRLQHRYRAVLEQRAAEAIATREREAERRVAEERVRIARDLHDVVGHEVAVVSMQLGIAEMTLPGDNVDARAALDAARVGVRNVLTETQHILAVLRSPDQDAPTAPVPGAARIPDLVASYRQLGLMVSTTFDDLSAVGMTEGIALYRVLQEALTNAHRHGSGDADVRITTTANGTRLRVQNRRDRSPVSTPIGSGLGLIGMRERINAAGGTLTAAAEGMLFVVEATLPIGSETP
jgi:signal transduction histidine kinase